MTRHTTAYLATSLDGFIADENGSVDWLNDIPNPEQSDYGFREFMDRVDAILMGRNTFDVVHGFGEWPYSKPVYVLSRSLQQIPKGYENRIRLVNGPVKTVLEQVVEETGPRVYVDGGTLVQQCLAENCLQKLILTTVPILLGKGVPLFPTSEHHITLTHQKTEVLGIGLVKTTYTLPPDDETTA